MKCPHCGHWNKASLPRCFQCGEPLNARAQHDPAWREQFDRPQPKRKRVVYDDTKTPAEDLVQNEMESPEEPLALRMTRLKDRRARGSAYLQDLRESAAEQGIAPSGSGVSIRRTGGFFTDVPDNPDRTVQPVGADETDETDETGSTGFYAQEITADIPQASKGHRGAPAFPPSEDPYGTNDPYLPPAPDTPGAITPEKARRRRRRVRGPLLIAYVLVGLLALGLLAFGGYILISYVVPGIVTQQNAPEAATDYHISEITIGGYPGRQILIPGEEGTLVYIKELEKSYVIVGGAATIEIADYFFYDDITALDFSTLDVTLTPTFIRNATETRGTPIHYTVAIPESEVTLIRPETNNVVVNSSMYNMTLQVEPRSSVIINGVNVSDTVSEDGTINYNPSVQAIGSNNFTITVRAPHAREKSINVVLYREPMDFPLEMDADTLSTSSKEEFILRLTTQPGAAVSVESPYKEIDLQYAGEDGTFTVTALMTRVGNNTIRVRASMPEKKDSVIEHTVYYVPTVDIYSKKAWGIDTAEAYSLLMANIEQRIRTAQIYVCTGVIREQLSENPQLAIMDVGSGGQERLLLLQNASKTTWEVGKKYELYADVSGVYDTMPRLTVRYTYYVTEASEEDA